MEMEKKGKLQEIRGWNGPKFKIIDGSNCSILIRNVQKSLIMFKTI